jgi:hypothetical protein
MAPQPAPRLPELVLAAELRYYRQRAALDPTPADEHAWHREQALRAWRHPDRTPLPPGSLECQRFLLERHGYSLHQFMARHLSPDAWEYWLHTGGLLHPINQ